MLDVRFSDRTHESIENPGNLVQLIFKTSVFVFGEVVHNFYK